MADPSSAGAVGTESVSASGGGPACSFTGEVDTGSSSGVSLTVGSGYSLAVSETGVAACVKLWAVGWLPKFFYTVH